MKRSECNSISCLGLTVLDIIIDKNPVKPVYSAGGTSGNVAACLSFLGWQSKIIARIGKGIAAEILLHDLQENGVLVQHISRERKLNTPRIIEKLTYYSSQPKHYFYLRCPTCRQFLPRFRSPTLQFVDEILNHDKTPDIFFLDRVTPASLKMARVYRERGALIFFEPHNVKHPGELEKAVRLCHVLKFSSSQHAPARQGLDEHTVAFLEYIKNFQPPVIIRTLGEAGAALLSPGNTNWLYKESRDLPKVVDCCGAGDWFSVGFLYYLQLASARAGAALIENLHCPGIIDAAVDFAQVLAAISCMFAGARGLSQSLRQDKILEMVEFYAGRKNSVIPWCEPVRPSLHVPFVYHAEDEESSASLCQTCILPIAC